MQEPHNLKRPLLYVLVASVIVGALLGIVIVLRNRWNWFEIRVMLTTIILATASLCGLACDLSRTPRGANLLPRAGFLLTFIGATLILIGMWSDLESGWFWKPTASLSVFAIATVHVCLLSIARLAAKFRWVFFIAWQVIYGVAMLICIMIIWEIESEAVFRFLAAISIVDAALTLVIPLLHRISKTEDEPNLAITPLDERNIEAIDEEISTLKKRISKLEKLRSEIAGGTSKHVQSSEKREQGSERT